MKVTLLSGLPASGKSTWALAQCAENPNVVRVNKDEIRLELSAGGWVWSQEREKDVVAIRDRRIAAALELGKDVIVDDTNFAHKHQQRVKELAIRHGASFVTKFFPVDIDEAIRRDALRTGTAHVGESVIRGMAKQYLPPPIVPYVPTDGLPSVILCDLDGTAALVGPRSPYDGGNCHVDTPCTAVRSVLWAMASCQHPVIYLSARDDEHMPQTQTWLDTHQFPQGQLVMRKTGDKRKDFIVKGELFDAHVRGRYNVLFVLDDRDQVVEYWRSLGLTCFQVAPGAF